MPAIGDLKEELEDIGTIKFIAQAFTEASASKIQKIRGAFEHNKKFYDEICHVYHLVRLSGANLKLKAKGLQPAKKALCVAVTSNQRFYGNINIMIMRNFVEENADGKSDLMVLGSTGHDFMRMSTNNTNYTSEIFAKDFPDEVETQKFLDHTLSYETVTLYYPKFVTLLTQTVGRLDITQMANPQDPTPEEEIHILFEPEYTQILEFFQHQVRHLLFNRIMLEADLSRTAARLLSMSAAEERSDEFMKVKKSELRKAINSKLNRQLLETFAGIKSWKQ